MLKVKRKRYLENEDVYEISILAFLSHGLAAYVAAVIMQVIEIQTNSMQ